MGILYNVGYQLGAPEPEILDGLVVHTCAADAERPLDELQGIRDLIIDPDVYLWGLDAEAATRTCAYAATYPWVPINVPLLEEFGGGRRDWITQAVMPSIEESWPPASPDELNETVRTCLMWQVEHGATTLVAPAPLITQVHEGLGEFGRWLLAASIVAPEFDHPVLMTVAFSEVCFPRVLEGLLDSITTTRNIAGCYLALETAHASAYVASNALAEALLEISYHVGHRLGLRVVVNFTDCFGLLTLAVGATDFVAGYGMKYRRFSTPDYEGSGGGPYPRFFSLRSCCRYLTEADMTAIRDGGFLDEFLTDRTPASDGLLAALSAGQSAEQVPEWEERRNNTATAKAHYVQRLRMAADEVDRRGALGDKIAFARGWLLQADALNALLRETYAQEPLDEDGSHVSVWRQSLNRFVTRYNLPG